VGESYTPLDMTRAEVVAFLEERFPPELAEEWDNSGLQVGELGGACEKVGVALDLSLEILPRLSGLDLLITHHPLLFRPLNCISTSTPLGEKIAALLTQGIACYALHTPYDLAQGGMGELLAGLLGLSELKPLAPRGKLLKLVVFVPSDHVEEVAQAIFAAGAGKIGRYGCCSFRSPGTGTFLPQPGTSPHIGEVGKLAQVDEVRLETVVPQERLTRVISAMLRAHPYEEVAYDLYPLEIAPGLHGLGRVGNLDRPAPASQVIATFSRELGAAGVQVYGERTREVSRVAVCGGSGGELWREALAAGAQLFLTGEIGYHQGLEAAEAGLTVAAYGHRESELPFVNHLASLLREAFPQLEVREL